MQTGDAWAGEYNRGDSRAFVYGSALKQPVTTLVRQYTVNVLAHSMGNPVTGEAMRQGMQVRNYGHSNILGADKDTNWVVNQLDFNPDGSFLTKLVLRLHAQQPGRTEGQAI